MQINIFDYYRKVTFVLALVLYRDRYIQFLELKMISMLFGLGRVCVSDRGSPSNSISMPFYIYHQPIDAVVIENVELVRSY